MSKKTATSTKKPQSKKSQAISIYKRMIARKNAPTRADIINELVSKVGLSQNGAATYYQNLKNGVEGWS